MYSKFKQWLGSSYDNTEHFEPMANLLPADQVLYHALRGNPDSIGFSPNIYRQRNPDVAAAKIDPLYHFVRHGRQEGRGSSFFFSPEWHEEMNEGDSVLHIARTRSEPLRKKAAFFAYAWNSASRPDAYMRAIIDTLADSGINVDVYIAGHYSGNAGTKGFRSDLKPAALGDFLRSQSYDFAISFNNALVMPETVEALECKIVSVLVDSMHHMFDHTGEGMEHAFKLPIHAAPIYTAFLDELAEIEGRRATGGFLPSATQTRGRHLLAARGPIAISWIASLLGDSHLENFVSRVHDEIPDAAKLLSTCLSDIERTGEISNDRASQQAARTLCKWSHWDYPLLEMHLQEIVTNAMRLAVVEKLAPLGLQFFGNARWKAAAAMSPNVLHCYNSGAGLRSHADLCAIYDSSKISINIPQVHAGTGMQYRVLDILASKSLLITQHVPGSDMEHLFGADSPIVTFTDIDDLHAKCAYYLGNEDERLARVKACNALVADGFSFRERVVEYLELSNPALAAQTDIEGRGSMVLIQPERVIEAGRKSSH